MKMRLRRLRCSIAIFVEAPRPATGGTGHVPVKIQEDSEYTNRRRIDTGCQGELALFRRKGLGYICINGQNDIFHLER